MSYKNIQPKRIDHALCIAILLAAFLSPSISLAATFHLAVQTSATTTKNFLSVVVLMDSDKPINTISTSILFPKNIEPTNIDTAKSVVNFWIDKPTWDEASRTLTFSGLIPGGIDGFNLSLLSVDCVVVDPSLTATLSFVSSATEAYLSDGNATPDTLSFENLVFPEALKNGSVASAVAAETPPEAFTPELGKDESVFNGQWFVAFSTEDKGTGIASYEVAERRPGILWSLFPETWQSAESPYLLTDQSLGSEIDVKAIDVAGNVRFESLSPRFPRPLYENGAFWIILIGIFLLYVVIRSKSKGEIIEN